MIDLYTSSSPDGAKVRIMLEETGLDYELHRVNLNEGEHKRPDYLAIIPNGKIPAIVDPDGPGWTRGRRGDDLRVGCDPALLGGEVAPGTTPWAGI